MTFLENWSIIWVKELKKKVNFIFLSSYSENLLQYQLKNYLPLLKKKKQNKELKEVEKQKVELEEAEKTEERKKELEEATKQKTENEQEEKQKKEHDKAV